MLGLLKLLFMSHDAPLALAAENIMILMSPSASSASTTGDGRPSFVTCSGHRFIEMKQKGMTSEFKLIFCKRLVESPASFTSV